ncbi:hypothetical protein BGZ79_003777 [Entomortierella chlamydospora]|nr:hypothetical protein BGZ79_003777 [Entomortierella chlamydospora]
MSKWIAQYGYLLIPLYKLDSEFGMWSVRQAVRRAVCQDIGSNKLNSDSRSDYIPIASSCIHSLYKLFQYQTKMNSVYQPIREPSVALEYPPKPAVLPRVTESCSEGGPSSGIYSTVNQAGKSLFQSSAMTNLSTSSIPVVASNNESTMQRLGQAPFRYSHHLSSTKPDSETSAAHPSHSHMTEIDLSQIEPSQPSSRSTYAASVHNQDISYTQRWPSEGQYQTVAAAPVVPAVEYLHDMSNLETPTSHIRSELFTRRPRSPASRVYDNANPATSSANGINPIMAAAQNELSVDALEGK